MYCIIFFDDFDKLRRYGDSISEILLGYFPNLEIYTSLYPTKRSRGVFDVTNKYVLISLFRG